MHRHIPYKSKNRNDRSTIIPVFHIYDLPVIFLIGIALFELLIHKGGVFPVHQIVYQAGEKVNKYDCKEGQKS